MISKIVVTTTQNLEGWEITDYLGPVFSHVVTGTGFFSDFAAGFSDIFGGQSESYQNQISRINNYAIESLKNKTALLGGNLLLGLRIDHDEISGKSKQMFMVTASGTAASGKKRTPRDSSNNRSLLTSDALKIALKKKEITDKCQPKIISLTTEEWDFITENQVHEIAPQMLPFLMAISKNYSQNPEVIKTAKDRIKKYFFSIPPEKSISTLYGALNTHEVEPLLPFIHATVFEGNLLDFEALSKLISSEKFKLRKWALQLVQSDKPVYSQGDIDKFSSLISLIKKSFVIRAIFVEEKSRFSSSTREEWLCECGKKNKIDRERCSSCSQDINGFKEGEITSEQAIKALQNKIDVLIEAFMRVDEG
jgi:uncharacterized protein YbjQ (UPF0145 family)